MQPESHLRIVFAGTPDFAVPPLQSMIQAGMAPVAVLTQPDRPSGRGRKLMAGPVKEAAVRAGIPVHQPESLKDQAAFALVSTLEPDLMVVVAYGLILPANILRRPRYGCWNIHASLLPRWRGAAPIQRAIEAGDQESGVCIMQMDEGLDTGPVIDRRSTPLDPAETGGSLHDRLSSLGAETLLACLQRLENGETIESQPQAESGVSYAAKLEKAEARIDWSCSAESLDRRIRAFNPWPVAWCMVDDERTRIWASSVVNRNHDSKPATVLAAGPEGIDIATREGVLRLLELQRPGGRRMSVADYLNARSLPDRLETPNGQESG